MKVYAIYYNYRKNGAGFHGVSIRLANGLEDAIKSIEEKTEKEKNFESDSFDAVLDGCVTMPELLERIKKCSEEKKEEKKAVEKILTFDNLIKEN